VINEITDLFGPWDAKILPNGNYLITEFSVSRVTERTKDGRVVCTTGGPNMDKLKNPYDANRLPNGHTLVAQNGVLQEFDRQGNVVWEKEMTWAVEANRY
jgi:hypothetical protein